MNNNDLRIIHYKDVPQGGFAGIVEKQMLISPKLFAGVEHRQDISQGLGDFVYLATGHFKPHDGADMHPHRNVDIVTVVLSGRLAHQGTVADGTVVHASGVQVQRAGSGMLHSEKNPGDEKAEFVQMWFLPPNNNLKPDHQNFTLKEGLLTTVLGGEDKNCFDNSMTCKVGSLPAKGALNLKQSSIVLITEGEATINGTVVRKGDLVEAPSLSLNALSDLKMVLIHRT